ncbi:MAG: hypothetical protein IJR14_06625 [Synergistaceae bacterium]|nr:hypothetical protein [Synergistaceae bacterium]
MMKRALPCALCALICLLPVAASAAPGPTWTLLIQGGKTRKAFVGTSFDMFATVYDGAGQPLSGDEALPVEWSDDSSGIVRVESTGKDRCHVTTLSPGTATITALMPRASGDIWDHATVIVVDRMRWVDADEHLVDALDAFNETLTREDMALAITDADPEWVRERSFQRAFRELWNVTPDQPTHLSAASLSFGTRTGWSSSEGTAVRPGVDVTMTGRARGEVLPMTYRWSYSWGELSSLLGRDVVDAPTAEDLFRALTVTFHGRSGAGWNVIGKGGLSAREAERAGPLRVFRTSLGVDVELTAYLANVPGPGSSPRYVPQLIEGLLIVPDGAADGVISGTMWMLERTRRENDSGEGSSSGGCHAQGMGMIAVALVALAARRRAR